MVASISALPWRVKSSPTSFCRIAARCPSTDNLSDREMEILDRIGKGEEVKEIARALHLSPKTVETHRAHIKEKLKLRNAREVARVRGAMGKRAARHADLSHSVADVDEFRVSVATETLRPSRPASRSMPDGPSKRSNSHSQPSLRGCCRNSNEHDRTDPVRVKIRGSRYSQALRTWVTPSLGEWICSCQLDSEAAANRVAASRQSPGFARR